MRSIFILLMFTSFAFSQITVSHSRIGKLRNIKKEDFAKFKNTKTVFVLSDVYTDEEYLNILKDSWTYTPYEVVKKKDLDLSN